MKYIFMFLAIFGLMVHTTPFVNTKGIWKQVLLLVFVVGMLLCADWVSK